MRLAEPELCQTCGEPAHDGICTCRYCWRPHWGYVDRSAGFPGGPICWGHFLGLLAATNETREDSPIGPWSEMEGPF